MLYHSMLKFIIRPRCCIVLCDDPSADEECQAGAELRICREEDESRKPSSPILSIVRGTLGGCTYPQSVNLERVA